MKSHWSLLAITVCLSGLALAQKPQVSAPPPAVDYNRDIRPILSGKCFACHGQDESKRAAGLRLDGPNRAVVGGDILASALSHRIGATDALQMPPADSGKTLTEGEKTLLRRWIGQGGKYEQHWAFSPLPPQRAGGVDFFIRQRLAKEKLALSPEADKTTLIRRVALDLTGLPPTPQEVDAFLADKSPGAYERVVDRLLASPRYGEKMAQQWMDMARYADSNGFQNDHERYQWRWRDWVIEAFNKNMPFNQFTIEQLAGDMLPGATVSQKLATGFNRNHRINTEGGLIAEEWRVEGVIDRLETTGAVWLGLSVGCARCHDHKYDPISQKEFYALFSYFNNVPESGAGTEGININTPPTLKAPIPDEQKRLAELGEKVTSAESVVKAAEAKLPGLLAAWEASGAAAKYPVTSWVGVRPSQATAQSAKLMVLPDNQLFATGKNGDTETYTLTLPTGGKPVRGIRLEVFPEKGKVGRSSNGNFVLTDVTVNAAHPSKAVADFAQNGNPIADAIDSDPATGWGIYGQTDKPHTATFTLDKPLTGESVTLTLRFGSQYGQHQFARFKVALTDSETPSSEGIPPAGTPERLAWFRANVDSAAREADKTLATAKKTLADFDATIPATMVMAELETPRKCYVLKRGQYDQLGDEVKPGLPTAFGTLPAGVANNRLGLAKWIASEKNPLTARVFVNRLWEKFFGMGLVATTEDFGTRADYPSHPELLDWLASEFIRLKWDMKAIQKTIVLSATYKQSSKTTPTLLKRDPENRLLARGPRLRLPGEVIRDQALCAAGLLVEKLGGRSVRPYQPEGFWDELNVYGNLRNYKNDKTPDGLYRRSLYTIWKRSAGPPTMGLFDVPGRDTCRVKRSRTNTPLQALALLNEVTFVEAARLIGQRMILEGGATADSRITWAYRTLLSRRPSTQELALHKAGLEKRLARYKATPAEAQKLLAIGETKPDPKCDPSELAAYAMTASILLNLDEAITRE
ncbi:PSD1 and planctomycete cytochrome C domain-containing protein [Armatimonas rosea]|uniref:Mono/diheme cytochrome c family protein n=1 Tax=Armatimonas rosea TaxID=685828 RepID=A0A7W9SQ01_ARMRO|nr:PSD1 and planctomycete cytochrome C domain-containing protein [Armatimonas rosea]MBB6049903.1 mono/diheme cytochrome c family protein [Armatimonas rosea]